MPMYPPVPGYTQDAGVYASAYPNPYSTTGNTQVIALRVARRYALALQPVQR